MLPRTSILASGAEGWKASDVNALLSAQKISRFSSVSRPVVVDILFLEMERASSAVASDTSRVVRLLLDAFR